MAMALVVVVVLLVLACLRCSVSRLLANKKPLSATMTGSSLEEPDF